MKTYRKTATVQGLPVTNENLPELQALPQVSVQHYTPEIEAGFRAHSAFNDVAIFGDLTNMQSFLVRSKEGVVEGEAGDVLMVGIQGERYICDAQIHRDTYQEVVFGEGQYVPTTSETAQMWSLTEWLEASVKEIENAQANWPTGEAVKEAALTTLKRVHKHVCQVAARLGEPNPLAAPVLSYYENSSGYTLLGLLADGALSNEAKIQVLQPILEEFRLRVEPLMGFSFHDEEAMQQISSLLLPMLLDKMPELLALNAAKQNLN